MEKLKDSHKFKIWKAQLEQNNLEIEGIEEVYTRRRYNGEVLFSLLMLDAKKPEGGKIPPICFLKGEVVTILVCLIDKVSTEKYLLLVKQRRIADGGFSYEHPAGMVDGSKTPLEIAIQEVKEETGITINESVLKPILNDKRLFPSTGTSDECMNFFFTELELSREEIFKLNNQKTGADYEEEAITTHVLPFLEAHALINNTNCILLSLAYLLHVKDWETLEKIK